MYVIMIVIHENNFNVTEQQGQKQQQQQQQPQQHQLRGTFLISLTAFCEHVMKFTVTGVCSAAFAAAAVRYFNIFTKIKFPSDTFKKIKILKFLVN